MCILPERPSTSVRRGLIASLHFGSMVKIVIVQISRPFVTLRRRSLPTPAGRRPRHGTVSPDYQNDTYGHHCTLTKWLKASKDRDSTVLCSNRDRHIADVVAASCGVPILQI